MVSDSENKNIKMVSIAEFIHTSGFLGKNII